MRTRLIQHTPLGSSPHQKGNATSPNVSWTWNSFSAGYRTVTLCWDFPLKQLTGSPTILIENFFTERMKGCVFQLKHLNKMPRQSRQCCQQAEGKVPSDGEPSGALVMGTQDILHRCSNSTGFPIPHEWFEIPKNRISVIPNYPGAQIFWMKSSLT